MDKKQGKPREAVRKVVETKREAEVDRAAKDAAWTRMPSIAAVMLAQSRRRITSSWQYFGRWRFCCDSRCGSSRGIAKGMARFDSLRTP